jgi:hypothetical protein
LKLRFDFRLVPLAALLFCAANTTTTHAANISWGLATNISGASDVSTTGTLINAVSLGGPLETVNGVTFNPTTIVSSDVFSGNFVFASNQLSVVSGSTPIVTPTSYSALLLGGIHSATASFSLQITGLTPGANYQLELWSNDSSGPSGDNLFAVSQGGSAGLQEDTNPAGGGLGQFVIGAFTADSTGSESITFGQSDPSSDPLNAVQLRQLPSVPEPTTALFGVATIGACALGRRRKSRPV